MYKITYLILLIAMFSCKHENNTISTTETANLDTIPIVIKRGGIYIPCTIGKDTLLFLFDTGTGRSTVSQVPDTNAYLGISDVYDINGNRRKLKAYAAQIKMGSFTENSTAFLHTDPIIGMTTISKYSWHFNLKHKYVIISNKEYKTNDSLFNTCILNLEIQNKKEAMHIKTILELPSGKRKKILIDTGNNARTLMLKAEEKCYDFTACILATSGAFSSLRIDTLQCNIRDIAIGKEIFSNLLIVYTKRGFSLCDGNLGLPLLQSFEEFIICPFSKKLILRNRRGSYQGPELLSFRFVTQFNWGVREHKKKINGIILNSDMDKAGLKIGDTFISSERKKDTIHCTVLNEGKIKQLKCARAFNKELKTKYFQYFPPPFNLSSNAIIDMFIEHCDSIIFNEETEKYVHYFKAPFQYNYQLQDSVTIKILND